MKIPDWYALLLVGVAAWRTFQLLAYDDILDRPRRWALRMGDEWRKQGDPVPDDYRLKPGLFLVCPYCCGLWLSLGIYLLWIWFPTEILAVSTVCALNAAVIGLDKILGKGEE